MSEPEAALLKFQVTRPTLTRWLRARPPLASRWDDWRAIGGTWHIDGEGVALSDASEASVAGIMMEADRVLAAAPDNRELLHDLITGTAETPELRLSAYDDRGTTFVAGSLTYSESLHDFVVFLAMARGIADHLAPEGYGLAVVHNYLWGSAVTAAVRMMPSGESRILPESERQNVLPAFQPIADALADDRLPVGFSVRDQLRLLG
jgi:hypothetical protein